MPKGYVPFSGKTTAILQGLHSSVLSAVGSEIRYYALLKCDAIFQLELPGLSEML